MTRGVRQIVRFNWPFYAGATLGVAAAARWSIGRVPVNTAVRVALYASIGVSAIWIVASLVASWIVHDRSPLMRWEWIDRALGFRPDAWINIHAGLDESTMALRALFGRASWRVFDIFDPAEMTEPSIARARRLADNYIAAETADFRHLPVPTGTIDVALLLLSAHELRTDETRGALFNELRRVLGPAGASSSPNTCATGPTSWRSGRASCTSTRDAPGRAASTGHDSPSSRSSRSRRSFASSS